MGAMTDAAGNDWTPGRLAFTFVLVLNSVLVVGSYVAPALGGMSLALVVSLVSGWVGFVVTRGVIRAGLLSAVEVLASLGGFGYAVVFLVAAIPSLVIGAVFFALYAALGVPGVEAWDDGLAFWLIPMGAWYTGAFVAYTLTAEPRDSERGDAGIPSVEELFATGGPAPSDLPLPTGYWTARTDRLAALRREFEAGDMTQAEYEARRDEILAG